jgi:hypothetical protein
MRTKSKRKLHKKKVNYINPAYEKLFEDRTKTKALAKKKKEALAKREKKLTIEYKKADGTIIARRSEDSGQGLESKSK